MARCDGIECKTSKNFELVPLMPVMSVMLGSILEEFVMIGSHWCRLAELGRLSPGAKMAMKIFVKRISTIFATNASFLRVIANLQN